MQGGGAPGEFDVDANVGGSVVSMDCDTQPGERDAEHRVEQGLSP